MCLLQKGWLNLVENNHCLDVAGHTSFFHVDELLGVVFGADNSLHLSLFKNEVNLLSGHSIVEADCGNVVVHASEERSGPLPAVLGPNAKEAPLLAFSLELRAHVKFHHTFGEVLRDCVNLVIGLPGIVSELSLASGIFLRQLSSCSQERLVASFGTVALENLEHGVAIFVVGNPIEVVKVLRVDTVADQLG